MFSCEFSEISKNTFFTEHLWATTFESLFTTILLTQLKVSFTFLKLYLFITRGFPDFPFYENESSRLGSSSLSKFSITLLHSIYCLVLLCQYTIWTYKFIFRLAILYLFQYINFSMFHWKCTFRQNFHSGKLVKLRYFYEIYNVIITFGYYVQ